MKRALWLTIWVLGVGGVVSAEPLDVEFLRQPWPNEIVRELEVGRYPVRWRQRVSRQDGLFAGVRYEAPLSRQAVWDRAADYHDIGRLTPGVRAVRFLEDTPTRQVIQLDVKVLWKHVTLTFEVERDPPREIRFRWPGGRWGELTGVCVFQDGSVPGRTMVELATRFQPSRPLPLGLLLVVERAALLGAVKEFLESCDRQRRVNDT